MKQTLRVTISIQRILRRDVSVGVPLDLSTMEWHELPKYNGIQVSQLIKRRLSSTLAVIQLEQSFCSPQNRRLNEPRYEKTDFFAFAKTKTQISFAVTAKLISAFVFAIRLVQFLFYPSPKFQVSSHLLWLYSPVCVGPGRKPRRPVFSQRGSNHSVTLSAQRSRVRLGGYHS